MLLISLPLLIMPLLLLNRIIIYNTGVHSERDIIHDAQPLADSAHGGNILYKANLSYPRIWNLGQTKLVFYRSICSTVLRAVGHSNHNCYFNFKRVRWFFRLHFLFRRWLRCRALTGWNPGCNWEYWKYGSEYGRIIWRWYWRRGSPILFFVWWIVS